MQPLRVQAPFDDETVAGLRAGRVVLISGRLIGARDAAHQRLVALIEGGERLPLSLRGEVIYYVGPAPAKPGHAIGSAGPTTSGRMDPYTPAILAQGVKGLIGKGYRSQEVRAALMEHRAVYLAAVGGAAAILAQRIKASRVVAYGDLGPEAIREFIVEDFPAVVVNDIHGGDLYERGRLAHLQADGEAG
jgi:fumarate hydratase subunit beta